MRQHSLNIKKAIKGEQRNKTDTRNTGNRKNEMADINPTIPTITSSVDEFNKLIRRQRLSNWTEKR